MAPWHLRSLIAGLALGVTASCAIGQSGASLEERFARLDRDGDGFIVWKEAEPTRASDFDAMDRNKDGAIDRREFASGGRPFTAFDSDGDQNITKDEFLSAHRTMFMRFDGDRDGAISLPEFAEAQKAAASQKASEGTRN